MFAAAGSITVTVVDGQQVGHLIVDNGKPIPKKSAALPTVGEMSTSAQRNGRVAALFPGQGSQYTNMFRELVAVAPEAKRAMDRMDQLARQLGYETLAEVAWRRDNALGIGIWERREREREEDEKKIVTLFNLRIYYSQ